ncbi:MAG: hypothetical protein KGL39_37045 [Patescibacteria group bacterium]|nr:hypothetical protein [Patescibacteria group bacterium]
MARRYAEGDVGLPKPEDPAEKLTSALEQVTGAAGMSRQELLNLVRSEIGRTVTEMANSHAQKKHISDLQDVAYLGNPDHAKPIVGREKILALRHELVTGLVPRVDPKDPRQHRLITPVDLRERTHPGLKNMGWVTVLLPWTRQDDDLYRRGQPPMNPKAVYPQVAGLTWRVLAGRKQEIPLIFAEALACAGHITPDQLPDGNGVRLSLEEELQTQADAVLKQQAYWRSIGVHTEDMQDVRPVVLEQPAV